MVRVVLAQLALCFSAPAMAQSLEQMAGQMIIVGFKGDTAGDASVKALRDEIAAGTLGGVMYLKPNVKSLTAVKAMNAAFRAASPDLPPFLTLDQEGGAVERLTSAVGFEELPNAETIAAKTVTATHERIEVVFSETVPLVPAPAAPSSVKTHRTQITLLRPANTARRRGRYAPDIRATAGANTRPSPLHARHNLIFDQVRIESAQN